MRGVCIDRGAPRTHPRRREESCRSKLRITGRRSAQECGWTSEVYRRLKVITRSARPPSAAYAIPGPCTATTGPATAAAEAEKTEKLVAAAGPEKSVETSEPFHPDTRAVTATPVIHRTGRHRHRTRSRSRNRPRNNNHHAKVSSPAVAISHLRANRHETPAKREMRGRFRGTGRSSSSPASLPRPSDSSALFLPNARRPLPVRMPNTGDLPYVTDRPPLVLPQP